MRLAERLFPEAPPWAEEGAWTASGEVPQLAKRRLEHPSRAAASATPAGGATHGG